MPGTAIVLIYTSQGFVFAADGLERSTRRQIISTKSQKIFPLRSGLAFSCAGFRSTNKVGSLSFEFPQAAKRAFDRAPGAVRNDFLGFAEEAAKAVNCELASLRHRRIIERYPDEDESGSIAVLFFAGYFHGEAKATRICFRHLEQRLFQPQIERGEIEPGFYAYTGSRPVWDGLVQNSNNALRAYRCDAFDRMMSFSGPDLEEAEAVALGFIRASSDPTIQLRFPECRSIGGYAHVATITPGVGFQWVIKPLAQAR